MYLTWKEECISGEKQRVKVKIMLQDKDNLATIISNLKEEVDHLNYKLEGMTKSIRMLNYGSETLGEILGVGKTVVDMKGI